MPDSEARATLVKHLQNLNNPQFKFSIAYHGSPHKFDKFTLDAIGTGEGAQVHGWGLYFAASRRISENYRKRLSGNFKYPDASEVMVGDKSLEDILIEIDNDSSLPFDEQNLKIAALENYEVSYDKRATIESIQEWERDEFDDEDDYSDETKAKVIAWFKELTKDIKIESPGRLFEVDIPVRGVMLDEQKKISEQPKRIREAIAGLTAKLGIESGENGWEFYQNLMKKLGSAKEASLALREEGVRGITYDVFRDGRCYVVFDDKAIKVLNKWSRRGEGAESITPDSFLAPDELSERQREIAEFWSRLGAPVVFFRNKNKNVHGAYANGILYINADGNMSAGWTFRHEAGHALAENNRALFDALKNSLGIKDAQIDNYRRETGRASLTDDALADEMIMDAMSETARRTGMLKAVSKKDRTLAERLVAWLKDMLDRFTDTFHKPTMGLTTDQRNKMYEEFGAMARELVDGEGNKIFRYNSRTHALDLADGRALPSATEKYSMQVDRAARNDDNLSERVFKKYLNEGIMKMVAETVSKEIGEHVDLSKMRDRIARDEARDTLPYIRQMLVWFNQSMVQNNPIYKDRLAVKIEYARRCFDNDDRIQSRAVRQVDRNERSEGKYPNSTAVISRNDIRGDNTSGGRGTRAVPASGGMEGEDARGISRVVSGGRRAAYEHFQKLYNEEAKHSDRGAFSMSGNTEKYSLDNRSVGDKIKGHISNIIGSEDNSTAALKQRISNWLTGDRRGSEPLHHALKHTLEDLTGMKIYFGKLDESVEIVTDELKKVIRSRDAYDFEKILPECGGVIAKRLALSPSKAMNNYIAKWIMTGAPNDESTEAKAFQKAMRENTGVADQLREAQGIMQKWTQSTAYERATMKTQYKTPPKGVIPAIKEAYQNGYNQFIEELSPVDELVKAVEQKQGQKVTDEFNPYVALRNYRGMAGNAKEMIEGDAKAVAALQQYYPDVKFRDFKTLEMILEEIGAIDNEHVLKEFTTFAMVKHLKDIHLKNKKDRAEKLEFARMLAKDPNSAFSKMTSDEIEATVERTLMSTPVSEEDCDAVIAEHEGKYGKSQQDLVRFSNTLMAILKDAGVISNARYYEMLSSWYNYVPLFRVFEENEEITFGDSLKHMTGSSRDVINPLQSIVCNTYDMVKRASKNKAKLMLANLARTGGVGELIDEVSNKKPDDRTTITFFEGGRKKYLQTDPAVAKAVNQMTIPQMTWFGRFLRIGTMILRNLATVYNPNFAIRNLLRDSQDAFLYSKYGYFTPMEFVKGFLHARRQDDVYHQWMVSGGAQASFRSLDRNYAEGSLERLMKGKYKQYQSLKGIGKLMQLLGEYSELGTRIAMFEKVKNKLAAERSGRMEYGDLVTAALESRDLMDFARGGKASREWNNFTAFANAHLQGIDKFCRTFDPRKAFSKDKDVRRQWQGAMFRLMIAGFLPALLTFMFNHDEDWYKKDVQP